MATSVQSHSLSQRIAAYLTILEWLPRYDRALLRPDVIAALTMWAVVVPQAIAYAQLAGLPPQAGLFAGAAALVGYALFGTSRQLIVNPTSATAAISASVVTAVALGDASKFGPLSAALAILSGIIFLVLGLARMGFISRFISPAVQTGYLFGLGLTIIIGQVPKLLGIPSGSGDFFEKLWQVITQLSDTNMWTAVIGFGSLTALLLMKRYTPRLPAALIVAIVSIVLVTVFNLESHGVQVMGAMQGAIPMLALPQVGYKDIVALVPGALALCVIAYTESVTVSEDLAEKHGYEIRPSQELVALGVGNVLAGLFQGFITGGGASQSAANNTAGARSQVVALVVSALTVLTVIALLPLFQNLPQAVLGAIVINAVLGFLRVDSMRRILSLRRDSFYLALIALGGVLLLGILPGLLVAIALSILVLLGYLSRPPNSVLGRLPGTTAYVSLEHEANAQMSPGLLIFRLDAQLLALNAKRMRDRLREQIRLAASPVRVVVLDLSFSSDLDIADVDVLNSLADEFRGQGIELWLANARARTNAMLERGGVTQKIGAGHIYRSINDAAADFEKQGERDGNDAISSPPAVKM